MNNYFVTSDNRIVYKPTSCGIKELDDFEYTVWGIGEHGFIHGAGSYLNSKFINNCAKFDKPTTEEVERFLNNPFS